MHKVTLYRLPALRSLAIGLSACAMAAQPDAVRISGDVQDASGAAIPNACVTLKVPGSTSVVSAIRTNEKGEFVLAAVPAGNYDLSVWEEGFVRRSLTVNAGADVVLAAPVRLQVAQGPSIAPRSIEEEMAYRAGRHREGTLEAHESCTLDVDAGQAICPAGDSAAQPPPGTEASDLVIKREGQALYFVPQHGATLGMGETLPDGRFCSSANYARDRSRIDGLPEQTAVCVQTKEGRKSVLWIWFKEPVCIPGDIRISFVTWSR